MTLPSVRLLGIDKSFGSAKILSDVSLDVLPGEVHALIGENGAGKSSLGKIVGGYDGFDAGTVFGQTVERWSPRLALQSGAAMIRQDLQLVPALSLPT